MNCPFCGAKIEILAKHYNNCKIKPHYRFINFGKLNCDHELLNVKVDKNIKNTDKLRLVINIKCIYCDLSIEFDTFETLWLPNIKRIM
jgi:hypothetical protein